LGSGRRRDSKTASQEDGCCEKDVLEVDHCVKVFD
jgi:hypothetical protein